MDEVWRSTGLVHDFEMANVYADEPNFESVGRAGRSLDLTASVEPPCATYHV